MKPYLGRERVGDRWARDLRPRAQLHRKLPSETDAARPGFALPLVLIVSLVVSTLVAVVLWRQSAQSLLVQKQIERYNGHHVAAGLKEVIGTWVGSLGSRPVSDALAEDGLALTLIPEAGVSVDVYFFEGQGTVLSDLGGLTDESFRRARGILAAIAREEPTRLAQLTRKHGPVAVSVNTAPEIVLRSAVLGAIGQDGKSLASSILSARGDGKMTSEQLNDLLQKSGLEEEQRTAVSQVLTAQPIVWNVVIRSDSGPGQEPVVYRGVALVGAGRDRLSGGLQRTTSIVSLERVHQEVR